MSERNEGNDRGRGRGRGRGGAKTSEEHNILSEIRAERQVTQRRVAALSPSVKKELLNKKRTAETKRVLLPDAPPRKRRTLKPSPEREPCCFVPGAGPSSAAEAEAFLIPEAGPSSVPPVPKTGQISEPKAGPSWEPEAEPSWEREAGPSWEPEARPSWEPEAGPSAPSRQPPIEAPDDAVIFEYVNMLDDDAGDPGALRIGMELAIGAEVDIHSTPKMQKRSTVIGIHDPNLEQTIDDWMQIESDDDLCLDDETDNDPPQTVRNASAEPASATDYSAFERQILEAEDSMNDIALRSIAPDNAYEFTWRKQEAIFQGRQETFTGTPGPTFDMTDQTSILDVFYKMIDVEFVDMLCMETNLYATQKIDLLKSQDKMTSNSRLQQWMPTDRDEMTTFLH